MAIDDPALKKPRRFLRREDVCDRLGIRRSKLHQLIERDEFPAGVPITGDDGRALGWLEEWVDNFIDKRLKAYEKAKKEAKEAVPTPAE